MQISLRRFLSLCAFFLLLAVPSAAQAGVMRLDPAFSLDVPEGWRLLTANYDTDIPAPVVAVFDGADLRAPDLKLLGWKMDANGKVEGAFCVTYLPAGMEKLNRLLQGAKKEERETIGAHFADTFAATLRTAYTNRTMRVEDISADFMVAGADFLLLMDARVVEGTLARIRSASVFIHGEKLLNIGWIHDENAAQDTGKAMEAMVFSLTWLQ